MNENVEDISKLSSKQSKAIQLLLFGASTEEISKTLRVNINTIYRWKNDTTFKAILLSRQNELVENSFIKIKSLASSSLSVLSDLICNSESDSIRLKASMFIIDKIITLNQEDIIERLNEIDDLIRHGDKN